MNTDIGVLCKKSGGNLLAQITAAKTNFMNAPHAGKAGHLPVHAHLHPTDIPIDVFELEGLLLLSDDTVRPGYIRITTCTFSAELAAEMGYLHRRLNREATRAA